MYEPFKIEVVNSKKYGSKSIKEHDDRYSRDLVEERVRDMFEAAFEETCANCKREECSYEMHTGCAALEIVGRMREFGYEEEK